MGDGEYLGIAIGEPRSRGCSVLHGFMGRLAELRAAARMLRVVP